MSATAAALNARIRVLTNDIEIRTSYVYENDSGEQRLVISISPIGSEGENAVAMWRTPDPELGKGLKAQGSATLKSFKRWAKKQRRSTKPDWEAFDKVQRRRVWDKDLARDVRRVKVAMRKEGKQP
tara:strand:+ start:740 stop:1117 length:378 start_codon:yes stop_codon:yes gene_type:complete